MNIHFNARPVELEQCATLADCVATLGLAADAISTAVNGEFVPRDARLTHLLREGDAVLTFQPITGG